MYRLTERTENGIAVLKQPYECEDCGHMIWYFGDLGDGDPIRRLAQYEKTGFMPVQIREMYDALAKAVYPHNARFKDYVDRYAVKHKITLEEALSHELVKQTCLMYMNVE